jgi:hypothetical protein
MLAVIGVHFANIVYYVCLMCVIEGSGFCDIILYYLFVDIFGWGWTSSVVITHKPYVETY